MRGKHKNISNRSQCNLKPSEPRSPTTASLGYPNRPEKQDSDLIHHLLKMLEAFKEDINNSLREIQERILYSLNKALELIFLAMMMLPTLCDKGEQRRLLCLTSSVTNYGNCYPHLLTIITLIICLEIQQNHSRQ